MSRNEDTPSRGSKVIRGIKFAQLIAVVVVTGHLALKYRGK